MHKLLAFFLVFFSGWTLSSHIAAVFQFGLKNLWILAPLIIGTMFTTYNYLNILDSNAISQKTAINFASSYPLPSRENLQRALSSLDVGRTVIANQNASNEKNDFLSSNNHIKKVNACR
jgi:hypothetical protein